MAEPQKAGSELYKGVHTTPAGANLNADGYLQREEGALKPVPLDVDIHMVMRKDKQQFGKLYEQMFRFYKDRNGNVSTPEQVAAALDATLEQIQNRESLGIVAEAKQDYPDLKVKKGDLVGFTYAMKSFDPASGKTDVQVEGTWVPNSEPANLRDRGVGRALIESIGRFANSEWNAAGVRWWTLGGRHAGGDPAQGPNPNTRFYDTLKNPGGQTRNDLTGAPSNRTDEQVFNLALTPEASQTYGTKKDKPMLPASGVIVEPAIDEPVWKDIYAQDLRAKGIENVKDVLPKVWGGNTVQDNHLRHYVVKKDDKIIGIALVRNGIKLPRDTFTFADVLALKFKDGVTVGPATFNDALTGIARQARDEGNGLLRMTFASDHPLVANQYIENAVIDMGEGLVVGPTRCPHKLYRLPVADLDYAKHVPAYAEQGIARR